MRLLALVVMVLAGLACGRVAFDLTGDGTGDGGDGMSLLDGTLESDLVLYFPFNEPSADQGLVDRSSGLTAACRTTAECPVAGPGAIGTAMVFDGVDDCLRVPDDPVLHQPAFTLMARVSHRVTANDAIVAKRLGPVINSANSFNLQVGEGINGAIDGIRLAMTSTTVNTFLDGPSQSLPKQGFHHVAATFDGVTRRLYVDGVTVAEGSGSTAYDATTDLTIGCDDNNNDDQYWDGTIEEVRMYRRPLSVQEILDLQ